MPAHDRANVTARPRVGSGRFLLAVVALVLATLTTAATTADSGSQPTGEFVMHEEYFPSLDGTSLHAYVFRPAWVGDAPTPVQVIVTPYANSGGNINSLTVDPLREPGTYSGGSLGFNARTFLEGYTAVVVSLRGNGGSRGCTDLGGPLEQADARAAVEWARERPWSNGKVAVTGLSYPGLGALMTLALRDDTYSGPDAIVFAAAPIGYEQVFENGVPQMIFGQLPYGWWINYRGSDLIPPSLPSSGQHENWLLGMSDAPECDPHTLVGNMGPDPHTAYWAERNIPTLVAGATVPVLGLHGFDDPGVPAKQFFPVMEALAGPWRALVGSWPHHPPGARDDRDDLVYEWLNHHLRGEPLADAPRWRVLAPDGTWRGEDVWPPQDQVPYELPLLPGSYMDMHGNQSESEVPDNLPSTLNALALPLRGIGSWTIGPPLPHDAHLSGHATVRVELETVAPGAHVIALLYEIDADGMAALLSRAASTVPGPGSSVVSFDLRPQDWRLEAGSRLGLLVTGADDLYFGSGNTLQPVKVLGGALEVPMLRWDRRLEELGPGAAPFQPWVRPAPFAIDASVIDGRTVDAAPPPAMEPRPGEEPPCTGPGHGSPPGHGQGNPPCSPPRPTR